MQKHLILCFYFLCFGWLAAGCRPLYAPMGMTETTAFMPTPSPLSLPDSGSRQSQHYVSGSYANGFRYLPQDFNQFLVGQYHWGRTKNRGKNKFETIALGGYFHVGNYEVKDLYFLSNGRNQWLGNYRAWGVGARFAANHIIKKGQNWYLMPIGYMGTLGIESGDYFRFRADATEANVVSDFGGSIILSNSYTFGVGCKIKDKWHIDFQNALSLHYFILLTYNVNLNVQYKKHFHFNTGVYTLGFSPAWRMGFSYGF